MSPRSGVMNTGTGTSASRTSWTGRRSSICAPISGACCASSRRATITDNVQQGGVNMLRIARTFCVAVVLGSIAAGAHAQTEIKVSYQPALYWALPFYVASEKGWWAELGLKPTFSTFPAGVPQIAASASKSWDVGGTGSVPAVLGAARYSLLTIGLTNDESAGNALVATAAKADAYVKNPQSMKGQTIVPNAHQPEAIAMMKKFYEVGGVTISDASMKKEFDTRPTFDLAAHLKAMDRSKGASQVDQWMTQIAEFMKGAGTLPEAPAASAYVSDEYMRLVDRDPKLKEFANRSN